MHAPKRLFFLSAFVFVVVSIALAAVVVTVVVVLVTVVVAVVIAVVVVVVTVVVVVSIAAAVVVVFPCHFCSCFPTFGSTFHFYAFHCLHIRHTSLASFYTPPPSTLPLSCPIPLPIMHLNHITWPSIKKELEPAATFQANPRTSHHVAHVEAAS